AAPVAFQPMAADDVADAVGRTALGAPLNGTIEVAGPERFRFDEIVRRALRARDDRREVVADPRARYYGAQLGARSLVPDGDARPRRDPLRGVAQPARPAPVVGSAAVAPDVGRGHRPWGDRARRRATARALHGPCGPGWVPTRRDVVVAGRSAFARRPRKARM